MDRLIFIGIIIVILLIYFLIIRPLTQRNRPEIYEPPRGDYYDRRNDYGQISGGMDGFGKFAGGMAAGALLTYLLEHNRIGYDQFLSLQNLEDNEIMRELMDQNIIQEHEIDQLQEELHNGDGPFNWDNDRNDGPPDDADYHDQDYQQDDNSDGDSGGDDNWV